MAMIIIIIILMRLFVALETQVKPHIFIEDYGRTSMIDLEQNSL